MPNKKADRFAELLPYGTIRDEIRNLPEAVFNKLDREWPHHWPSEQGPRDLLRGLVRTSRYTFRAAFHLVSDDADPARKPEFAIALPPLVRALLDALVTLILLFDDFPANSRWYFRAGWRELKEYRDRIAALYAHDALWAESISELQVGVEKMRKDFGITKAEAATAEKSLRYWPIPPQVARVKGLDKQRAQFVDFLITAHYRELSQDAHLSWPGFMRRAGPLLDPKADLKGLKQGWFQIALILLVAILTEIACEGRLDVTQRLQFLWTLLSKYLWFAEALYEKRYAALLQNKW